MRCRRRARARTGRCERASRSSVEASRRFVLVETLAEMSSTTMPSVPGGNSSADSGASRRAIANAAAAAQSAHDGERRTGRGACAPQVVRTAARPRAGWRRSSCRLPCALAPAPRPCAAVGGEGAHAMRVASAASGLRSRSAAYLREKVGGPAPVRLRPAGRLPEEPDRARQRVVARGRRHDLAPRPARSRAASSAATAVAVSAMATVVGLRAARPRHRSCRPGTRSGVGTHRGTRQPGHHPDDVGLPVTEPDSDRCTGAGRTVRSARAPHAAVVHAREATDEPDDGRVAARRPRDRLRVQNGERADIGSQLGASPRRRTAPWPRRRSRTRRRIRRRGAPHLDARRWTGRVTAGRDHARGQCGDDDRTSHVARRRSRSPPRRPVEEGAEHDVRIRAVDHHGVEPEPRKLAEQRTEPTLVRLPAARRRPT